MGGHRLTETEGRQRHDTRHVEKENRERGMKVP
jgi:hypothetical protein